MKIRFVCKNDSGIIYCRNSWFNAENKELAEFEVENVTELQIEEEQS